jgi:hypothetical protein
MCQVETIRREGIDKIAKNGNKVLNLTFFIKLLAGWKGSSLKKTKAYMLVVEDNGKIEHATVKCNKLYENRQEYVHPKSN